MINLPREQVEAILNYLMQRPYGEVATACEWLQAALESSSAPVEGSDQ